MTQIAATIFSSSFAPRRSIVATLAGMATLARQRKQLSGLDAHILADIGVSAERAAQEANRPFWDLPNR